MTISRRAFTATALGALAPWPWRLRRAPPRPPALACFEPTPVRRVRVVVEDAVAEPRPLRIGLYEGV